jgi:hypothetical protein
MRSARSRLIVLLVFLALVPFSSNAVNARSGQGRTSHAFTEIKWDDYTFKFLTGNQMGQVLNANGQAVGTILSMNGDLQVVPSVTGADAEKLKNSFAAWKAQGGEKALSSSAPGGATAGAARRARPGDGAATSSSAKPSASSASSAVASSSPNSPAASTAGAAAASPSSTPAAPAAKYAVLQPADLKKFGNGAALRLDLNLLRLQPQLLDQKPYMRYFIALNNCNDKSIAKMLDNELDYPDLVTFYKPKAQEILSSLPMSAGAAIYNDPGLWKKALTLGEYDKAKGAFPILYGGQPGTADVPATINFEFGKTTYRNACPVAVQVSSSHPHEAMPEYYSVTIKPMSFKELALDEAAARKYIEGAGSSRGIILIVDVHLLDTAPTLKKIGEQVTGAQFAGEIARVRVTKLDGTTVGVLFDNHTPPPQ